MEEGQIMCMWWEDKGNIGEEGEGNLRIMTKGEREGGG